MALFMLSYDATEVYYETENFREDLATFLMDKGATDLHSYVESTILFEDVAEKAIKTWTDDLMKKYNIKVKNKEYKLYFVLGRIAKRSDGTYIYTKYPKANLDNSLQEIITKIQVAKKAAKK